MTRPWVLAVDLGGTKIMAALVDPRHKVHARFKKKTKAQKGPREILARVVQCVQGLLDEHNLSLDNVAGLGVAVAGAVDPHTGRVVFAPNLGFKNTPLKKFLHDEFGLPVFIENDVKAGALAEARLGAGRKFQSVVGLFLGTGVGGGLIFNHQVYRGAHNIAGEVGHMILDVSGPLCGCGQRGCLEAFAGRLSLVRDMARLIKKGHGSYLRKKIKDAPEEVGSRDLREALEHHDKVTRKVLDQAARRVGQAVANLANVLNPEAVVLGGGVVEAVGDYILPRVREAARRLGVPAAMKNLAIVASHLKDDAVILGAALTAREGLREK